MRGFHASYVVSGTSLTTLDLSGSSIGDVSDAAFAPVADSLEQLILDRAIVSPRALDAMFAGLAAGTGSRNNKTGSSNSSTQLQLLSVRNVFVDESHEASVGQHLFRHLTNTRSRAAYFD